MAIVVINVEDDNEAVHVAKEISKQYNYHIVVWSSVQEEVINSALLLQVIHGFEGLGSPLAEFNKKGGDEK